MKKLLIKNGIFNHEQLRSLVDTAAGVECLMIDNNVSGDILAGANAVIGNLSIPALAQCPGLEWLQLNSSGADDYARSELINPAAVITTATGAYGIGIAEYMAAMLLGMMKRIPAYHNNQLAGIWRDEGAVTSPSGKRVLVVGTGNIGTEFARRIRAFGAKVVGIRRRAGVCPPDFDEIHGLDELKSQLPLADVIALCLPGSDDTLHLMNAENLALCKEGAYLMNVGRGNVIPLDAMLDPAVTGRFAGIWLDVCEVEPLPDGHPLFSVPNLLVTPHITGGFHLDLTMQNIYEISLQNLKAWLGQGEYRSVLDRKSGYCR